MGTDPQLLSCGCFQCESWNGINSTTSLKEMLLAIILFSQICFWKITENTTKHASWFQGISVQGRRKEKKARRGVGVCHSMRRRLRPFIFSVLGFHTPKMTKSFLHLRRPLSLPRPSISFICMSSMWYISFESCVAKKKNWH